MLSIVPGNENEVCRVTNALTICTRCAIDFSVGSPISKGNSEPNVSRRHDGYAAQPLERADGPRRAYLFVDRVAASARRCRAAVASGDTRGVCGGRGADAAGRRVPGNLAAR